MWNDPTTLKKEEDQTVRPTVRVNRSFVDQHLNETASRYNTTHYQLDCPFCPDCGHSPDTEGKLYVDRVAEVGFCFRCHTKVKVTDDAPEDSDAGRDLLKLTRTFLDTSRERRVDYGCIPYFDLLFPKKKETLDKLAKLVMWRSPQYLDLISIADLRYYEVESRLDGKVFPAIVIPFKNVDTVMYYQMRWRVIPPWLPDSMKYWMPPGKKPFFHIHGEPFAPVEEITLVEGVIDNWGAVKLGFPHVLSVQGSSMPEHLGAILKANPNLARINIYLDKTGLSERLGHSIRDLGLWEPSIRLVTSTGTDPDEYFIGGGRKQDLIWAPYAYVPPDKRKKK